MKYLFILIAPLYLISCKEKKQSLKSKQQELEIGSLDSANQYKAAEIGWTTTIPEGWDVLTKNALKVNNDKGKDVIEKSMDIKIDDSELKQLLNLKKDAFNSFLSTIEPYDEKQYGSHEKNSKKIFEIVKETYASKNIKATYKEDTTLIDGLNFTVFKIKIFKPASKEILLNQVLYSRYINGYSFGMTINYNDESALKQLEKMVFESKFSERE